MIKLINLVKYYGNKNTQTRVLDHLSLTVNEGEMIAIIGKSGSGKTTLLNILAGIVSVDEGQYLYKMRKVNLDKQTEMTKYRREKIGMVIQNFALMEELTVYQNIILPLKLKNISKEKRDEAAISIMKALDIENKRNCYLDELSRGEQQRIAIARAIIKTPDLLLADEPTGSLDEISGEIVMNIFQKLNNEKTTIIIATHDMDIAKQCGRILRLENGKLVEVLHN